MAVLTVQRVVLAGLNPTFAAAGSAGDLLPNDGRTILVVKNGGTASINVTPANLKLCERQVDHDVAVAVPAGEERWLGSFKKIWFDNSSGQVAVAYSGTVSVTVAAIHVSETGY